MSTEPGPGYRSFPSFQSWTVKSDLDAVDRFFTLLDEAKTSTTAEQLRTAVEVATRYAAVDTGALEGLYTTNRGFTRTIATQAATWQAALSARGEPIRRSIQDQLAAYEMVLDLATRRREISASWIRQLHEVVCASQATFEVVTAVGLQQQPLPKGQWKLHPNNPGSRDTGRMHHYAPPDDVGAEMTRFVDELQSEDFFAAHPVAQTAYAHYAFVCIHPFADGNGRVARALASVFLYRRPGIPLVVFADQKDAYLDSLEAADDGRIDLFVAFVAQRVIDAVELVRLSLNAGDTGTAERAITDLARSAGRGGLSFAEVDALRARLVELVRENAEAALAEVTLPGGYSAGLSGISDGRVQGPAGYRDTPVEVVPTLNFQSEAPGDVHRQVQLVVFAARAGASTADFQIRAHAEVEELDVSIQQLHPVETQILDIKLATWLRTVINSNLNLLADASRSRLRELGYL